MIDAVGAQGGAQRIGHLRLADQFGECLRAIPAIEGSDHLHRIAAAPDLWPGSTGAASRSRGVSPESPTGLTSDKEKGPLAHPSEPGYPCCVSALGELAWMAPREEPTASLADETVAGIHE